MSPTAPGAPSAGSRSWRHLARTAFVLLLVTATPPVAASATRPAPPPYHEPVPVTAEAEPVLGAAVARDGSLLVYASGRGRFRDLWLRSADPNVVVVPRRLTTDPGDEHSPAISPDGRWVAYVGTGHDAKGDIYLLDLAAGAPPARMTGRDTADGGPSFTADSGSLIYHRAAPGQAPHLAEIPFGPLGAFAGPIRELKTGGDAQDPAPSPTGPGVVFVSRRNDPGGDLFLLERPSGQVIPLTRGPEIDASPGWSVDGRTVRFARRAVDTDGDGRLTVGDRSAVYQLTPTGPEHGTHSLTSASWHAEHPQSGAPGNVESLYFLSDRGGIPNIWRLPVDGEIPILRSGPEQMELAERIAALVPSTALRTALAYTRVRDLFAGESTLAARASYAAAETYRMAGYPLAAVREYRVTVSLSQSAPAPVLPEEGLAQLALTRLDGETRWRHAAGGQEQDREKARTLEALQAVARHFPDSPRVQVQAQLQQARWLLERGRGVTAVLEATQRLDNMAWEGGVPPDLAAEALLLRADALARGGNAVGVVPAYRRVLEEYPEQDSAADRATRRLLDLVLETGGGLEQQVQSLRQLAAENRLRLPRLAAAALNRGGDLLFNAEEWARAKGAYRQVLDEFPAQAGQRAAARLALAEILYREERFRQALDLYENELTGRTSEDRVYRLARAGYIRRSVAAAEFLFGTGELLSAQGLFRDLAVYDDGVVEAHRGIIKCSAALGEIDSALAEYRRKLGATPDYPLAQYLVGLCLTYLGDRESLNEARRWIERGISRQGQVEYYHQTLGYVQEVLETVHGERGMLELAADSYQRALFLNDPDVNPENAANLLLNLGNAQFLLGQPALAFRSYRARADTGRAFANAETEILFYRRLGSAAFQIHEQEQTIAALERALELLRAHAEPTRASRLYDDLVRMVQEQYLSPPSNNAKPDDVLSSLAVHQSELRAALFSASARKPHHVPSPLWEAYRGSMVALLIRQEALHRDLLDHLRRRGLVEHQREQARRALSLQLARIRQALAAPLRYAELEAELLDRLGLGYQEAERWEEAADTFDEVFVRNQRLGHAGNLARNRRSAAYNRYRGAGTVGGSERIRSLRHAAEEFRQVIELVGAHGVTSHQADPGDGALIEVTVQVPLAVGDATQAAYGFSAAQEQRLAEAFLTRIAVELGDLGTATEALRAQLARYPGPADVPAGDRYGVSLLHHRAGLLAFARSAYREAFARFGDSAALSSGRGNAASTALNVADMGAALVRLASAQDEDATAFPALALELERADRRAAGLLRGDPTLAPEQIALLFHSAMGVHWLDLASRTGSGIEAAVLRMKALQRAAGHFSAGLDALPSAPASRLGMARAARLHLGAARTASELGDSQERVDSHLEAALRQARRGRLPDLEWRALAGRGQLEEALAALQATPLLRAHARPGEISWVFGPLVDQYLEAGEVESALGLMEEVAELDRVHRLAPLLTGSLTPADRRLLRKVRPRLLRIRGLVERVRERNDGDRAGAAEELRRERNLLEHDLGPGRQRLPELIGHAGPAAAQDTLLLLLGLALAAEDAADQAAAAVESTAGAALDAEYRVLRELFSKVLEQALAGLAPSAKAGLLEMLAPRPAEAVELLDALPEGEVLARVWRLREDGESNPWLALLLTADGFEQVAAASAGALLERIAEGTAALGAERFTLAHEDPARFGQAPPGTTLAFSGTHWLRSLRTLSPLRSSLLVLPGEQGERLDPLSLSHRYRLIAPHPGGGEDQTGPHGTALDSLRLAHTVLFAGHVYLGGGVPTRAGETSHPSLLARLEGGIPLPLTSLLGGLPRASLAILPKLPADLWFEVGHLLSVAGVGTVAVPLVGGGEDLAGLLDRYPVMPAWTSARDSGWLLLGSRGMTPEQAANRASEQFAAYARAAQEALGAAQYPEAAAILEDALLVSAETASLQQYLPELHRLAREATFAAGDTARAAHHARALVAHLEKTRPDSEEHADALLRLGLVWARLESFDRALPALEEAAEMLANLELSEEAAAALASMGVVLENATEYDRALQSFRAAAELGADLERGDLVAAQQVNLGRLYDLRLSRWARAKQHYLAALELYDQSGDLPGVIRALLDAGRCDRLLGNFPAAAERYQLALELLEEEPDPILGAKVTMEQANNAWFQGRYQEAFELQQQVLTVAREQGWDLGRVLARNTAGLTWWTLGDNDRALRELRRALDSAEQLEGRADEVATSLNNIGLVQREQGQFEEALDTLNRALEIDRRLQSRWAIAYDLRNIGLTLLHSGQARAALEPLREAASEAEAIGDRVNEAKARLALAEALWALDEPAPAADLYRLTLEMSRSMALRETEWRALHGLARARLAAEDPEGARELLYAAVEVVEGMRAAIKLEQLRDGFLTDKLDAYQLLIKVLVDRGETERAFAVAERSRARNFIDLLGNQRLTLRGAVEQGLYERQQALQARREEQEALLAQAETEFEQRTYQEALASLADEQTDLLLNIQVANPELASLISVQPVDSQQVRRLLEPGVTLLAYYLLEDELLCWVLRADRLALTRTPMSREELQRDIFAYRRLVQNLEPLHRAARSLHDRLLAPLRAEMSGTRYLGIIPHRSLHYLSFATLGDDDGFLVERFPLFYLPSASVLGYTLERRQEEPNRKVLALGNPDLGTASLELPFAEQEVGTIRWNFPEVTVLTGERATEAWVVRNLGAFGIIHLASHGEFDPVNPLFSALKLTRGEDSDGDLQAAEVFGLEINADLVVLSACQTGVGRVTGGDDVIGLNRAFFYAGTHAIVSSLWRVSDVSTAILMKQFYRQLGGARSKAESLRAAMLHVKTRYPHPGYWGAFSLAGDYQ